MQQQELKLNITTDQKEVVIYAGEAPKKWTYEKQPLKIQGTIAAVVNYFEKRWENLTPEEKGSTMVRFDKSKGTLDLVIDEKHPKQDVVSGKVLFNPDLLELEINTDKLFTVPEFWKLLRLKRSMFPKREDYNTLLEQLKNFQASSTGKVETADNEKGTKKIHLDKTLDAKLPDTFILECEIIKGEGSKKIQVELCREMIGMEVKLWLISNDLVDTQDATTEKVFTDALKVFQEKDVPCFEQ